MVKMAAKYEDRSYQFSLRECMELVASSIAESGINALLHAVKITIESRYLLSRDSLTKR